MSCSYGGVGREVLEERPSSSLLRREMRCFSFRSAGCSRSLGAVIIVKVFPTLRIPMDLAFPGSSAPSTTFSTAGSGAGEDDLGTVISL